jgi:hypothetical protein
MFMNNFTLEWNYINNSQNNFFKQGITKYAYWLNYGLCIIFNKHEFSKMLLIKTFSFVGHYNGFLKVLKHYMKDLNIWLTFEF